VVDAAQAYERAADLDFSEDTALRLISAWRAAGRRDRAARVLSLYLGQNPNSIAASRIAASAWLDARNWGRAIAILEPLRQRTGGNVTLLMTDLAWAWLGKGDTRRALVYAAKAYRLQPSSPVAADTYGWVMLQTGHREAAVDLLEKAVALAPEHPMLRKHLDKAYAALGARET
jgi:tetratricopeptide (TPR) repeat protein